MRSYLCDRSIALGNLSLVNIQRVEPHFFSASCKRFSTTPRLLFFFPSTLYFFERILLQTYPKVEEATLMSTVSALCSPPNEFSSTRLISDDEHLRGETPFFARFFFHVHATTYVLYAAQRETRAAVICAPAFLAEDSRGPELAGIKSLFYVLTAPDTLVLTLSRESRD